MKRFSPLISSYVVQSILPYLVFSWLLLSVILFVQQASRFSDIFFSANIPKNLVWQLTLALVPNVITFTCPMAVLVGVIIGLSKMQGDSELVAVRAAGVGNFQITFPILVIGILLSFFAFFINLNGVPFAARIVRKVALQTALYKLESPIEPGVFNTEINGYTIYAKDGDLEQGTWKNIFIYNEDKSNGLARLITSKSGRIDTSENRSELVLEKANVNTFSTEKEAEKFISENVGQIRIAIETKRSEIIEKLSKSEGAPEELGLRELAQLAKTKEGKEKTEAQILWQRRIILSITPIIFALLGTALVLRFNRGGKGFGIFLALVSLVIYYLLALLGEQLARTNQISVLTSSLLPVLVSFFFIFWFFLSTRFILKKNVSDIGKQFKISFPSNLKEGSARNYYIDLTTGILDLDIVLNLLKYFFLTFGFLTTIYMIFTAFELWKFAGEINNGISLLIRYLLFLIPFIYIQLAPSALMIATLATFVIKSRQNEIVSWTAAGQSVYRLFLPCFVLMIFLGVVNWGIQEWVAPKTNVIQDELRAQIRGRGVLLSKTGKNWVANDKRIYSFELGENKSGTNQTVKNLTIYEFSDDSSKLQTIFKSATANWEKDKIKLLDNTEKTVWSDGKASITQISDVEIKESSNPFNSLNDKPNHLTTKETKEQINNSESETEQRIYEVALEKKTTTPFLPLVITLFTAPFALSLSRKGKVRTISYAIAIWLLFIGITTIFEQFGLNGFLAPETAVWSPLLLFSMLGIFLLSKVKT
ncbi:MAG: LptF/LptG family permease [Acidobacteria bacterium]|jgi:LPS export ABC transporter permease LptG|nr:LptF/LptG family permease [Acidobacteriota bacterium]